MIGDDKCEDCEGRGYIRHDFKGLKALARCQACEGFGYLYPAFEPAPDSKATAGGSARPRIVSPALSPRSPES